MLVGIDFLFWHSDFLFGTMINIKTRLPGAVPHQIGLFFVIEFRVELSELKFVLLDAVDF